MLYHIALSFLTLSVITSCTNDDSLQKGGKRITISAESQKKMSTRIGLVAGNAINEDGDYDDDDLFWLSTDKVSIAFCIDNIINTYSEFKYEVDLGNDIIALEGVGPNAGKTNYDVYAIYPENEKAFIKGAELGTVELTIENRQDAGNSGYANIDDLAYMWAGDITASFDENNELKSDVLLQFKHLTALLRFNILNKGTQKVIINGISLRPSEEAENTIFYTKAKLNAKDGTLSSFSDPAGRVDVGLRGMVEINPGNTGDGYICIFPTTSYTSIEGEIIRVYITYNIEGDNKEKNDLIEIPLADLKSKGRFEAGYRYIFEVGINN